MRAAQAGHSLQTATHFTRPRAEVVSGEIHVSVEVATVERSLYGSDLLSATGRVMQRDELPTRY